MPVANEKIAVDQASRRPRPGLRRFHAGEYMEGACRRPCGGPGGGRRRGPERGHGHAGHGLGGQALLRPGATVSSPHERIGAQRSQLCRQCTGVALANRSGPLLRSPARQERAFSRDGKHQAAEEAGADGGAGAPGEPALPLDDQDDDAPPLGRRRGGRPDRVAEEHKQLQQWIDRAAARGAIHRNLAARKKAQAARLVTPRQLARYERCVTSTSASSSSSSAGRRLAPLSAASRSASRTTAASSSSDE